MKVDIRGLDELQAIFDQLEDLKVLEQPMQRSAERVRDHISNYSRVAGTPRRSYRRTGQLGRGWAVKKVRSGNDLLATVSNRVAYGPFVQSHEMQAGFHRSSGWKTDRQVLDFERTQIERELEAAIEAVVKE